MRGHPSLVLPHRPKAEPLILDDRLGRELVGDDGEERRLPRLSVLPWNYPDRLTIVGNVQTEGCPPSEWPSAAGVCLQPHAAKATVANLLGVIAAHQLIHTHTHSGSIGPINSDSRRRGSFSHRHHLSLSGSPLLLTDILTLLNQREIDVHMMPFNSIINSFCS